MYHLLIVDDEKMVVNNLALTIPWTDYGIEEVYTAYSAAEALEIASRQGIDILITDIQMPEMNGLELIEQINKLSRKVKCIILSGHDDFQYAQKAMKHNTFDYLLKPVVIEDLVNSVLKSIEALEAEWREVSSYQRMQYTLKSNLPLLKDQFLNDLIKKKPMYDHIFQERLQMLGLPFHFGDPYMMMLVRLEEDFSGYDLQSLSLLEYAVTNIIEEVFQDVLDSWHCISEQGYLVFLVKSKQGEEKLKLVDSFSVKIQNHVQTYLKGQISICLSKPHVFPEHIAELYQRSITSINRNIGANRSYFITMDQETKKNPQLSLNNLYEPPLLPQLLESESWDEALLKLEHILQLSDQEHEFTYDQLFSLFLYLSSLLSLYIQKEGMTQDVLMGEEFDYFLRKSNFLSKQRLYEWVKRVVDSLREHSNTNTQNTQHKMVAKVRTYIQEHLADGITVQIIADHIGLHPVYLSKVYKTVTGETIGDYLHALRMEKASYLVKHTDLKVAEIGAKLGFLSPAHFIKVFKKEHGLTPQEFRNES